VREFIARMKGDAAFRARVLAAAGADERVALIQAEGYDVTAEEIAGQATRLEDDELAHAVGGVVVAAPAQLDCTSYVGC
jgi:predicted ribosomally synthesized peptide with nif11-like leader